ncbi:hypothetical protein [Paraflavitalea sp. CAU 1676]|uniref:hypothetical protein n=1 Tax=Paraflavitalea sp. CAU 1676 TaxID=3032598 RepID=UPI0023DAC613|nr:hypothetical protein [Paraflavitalea sp. CAU 1676]MDF2192416.1 hypothetical protein [Paraflavitalea sp. CAU 1676]
MKKRLGLFIFVFLLTLKSVFATTWDEPWANQVIKQASSFVLAKVNSTDEEKGISIQIIKTLGGNELKGSITITNFYLLTICSTSGGHGAEFQTLALDSCYFFIKQNNKGEYCIATPTTGFDYVYDSSVAATFRHSYHQASVPVPIYEKVMTAIFNNYHGLSYDQPYMLHFAQEYLTKKPAGFGPDELNTFFLQHVALESICHLKLSIQEQLILPFLKDKTNFHNQISAARALGTINSEISKKELTSVVADTTIKPFVRVMCVWGLADLHPVELKAQFQKIKETASDEADGFGGNIMDPRVCTHIPSIKKALQELVEKL